jgi:hypothetical protein
MPKRSPPISETIGGLPQNNVRLLRDWNALRPDIEEALLDWLPAKTTKDSLVVVYFAGQAVGSPSGETFLGSLRRLVGDHTLDSTR